MKKHLIGWLAVGCSFSAMAGTIVADSVEADVIRTREIGYAAFDGEALLYYGFETETVDGVVWDGSENGYDGAASGCVWSNSGRYNGGAMSFDGYGDNISVGTGLNFPSWNTYSVSIWFRHNGGGEMGLQYGHKMLDKTTWYHDWHINLLPLGCAMSGTGGISLSTYEDGLGSRIMSDSSQNFGDNLWHHVVVVRNGTNGQFWVDGVLKQTIGNMISVNSDSALCVGNSYSGDSYQRTAWSGDLDEIRIYNRPLSEDEIQSLFTEGALEKADPAPVAIVSDVIINGRMTVTGQVSFLNGVFCSRPLGDLSSGIYTNGPVLLP